MKFEEWFNKFYVGYSINSPEYFAAEAAWIASKNQFRKEILSFLKENICSNTFYIKSSIIEEVKNI